MIRAGPRIASAWLCLLASAAADADLVVIYDNGQSRPIADFLAPLQKNPSRGDEETPSSLALGAAEVSNLLPIRSPGLSPGKVGQRALDLPFRQAFFLLGSDEDSKRWLRLHRDHLLELGAVGLLLQADSVQDLEAIAEIADGLPITPASGSDIAHALGIEHYPVAISDGHLWQ